MESARRMDNSQPPDRTQPFANGSRRDALKGLAASVGLHALIAIVILGAGSVRRAEPPPVIDLGLVPPVRRAAAPAAGQGAPAPAPAASPTPAPAAALRPTPRRPAAPPLSVPPDEPAAAAVPRSDAGAADAAREPLATPAPQTAGPPEDGVASPVGGAGAAVVAHSPPAIAPSEGGRDPRVPAAGHAASPANTYGFIRSVIQRGAAYPALARRMGWEGKVVVGFRILPDGTVRDIRVVEGSGHPVLDRSAVEAVRGASPFPRPPQAAEIRTPVVYRLQ